MNASLNVSLNFDFFWIFYEVQCRITCVYTFKCYTFKRNNYMYFDLYFDYMYFDPMENLKLLHSN